MNFLQHICNLPEKMHPYSASLLEAFWNGRMSLEQFLFAFHLPNSSYIEVGRCIAHQFLMGQGV